MAFVGERHRLEGDITGEILISTQLYLSYLWTSQGTAESSMDRPSSSEADARRAKVSTHYSTVPNPSIHFMKKLNLTFSVIRKLDARGRQQIKKDCDEVFPQIIIGTGDCIKDVSCSTQHLSLNN